MAIEQLGPYKIEGVLGHGGMGTVYAGVDADAGTRAAIKVLQPALAERESFRARFAAEVETLKKLRHPTIVELYGFGEHDGHMFYAMELVEGTNLQEELRQGRRFGWREVVRQAIDVSGALGVAHTFGVVHRDLKPGNLLLDQDERIRLTDFGIAWGFGDMRLTGRGGVLGTADFMAPEQAEGASISPRSDLYSLGAVMYTLLAGRPPFLSKTIPETIRRLRFEEPDAIDPDADDVPVELIEIVMRLLSKDPADRIPTAKALAGRLEEVLHAKQLDDAEPDGHPFEGPTGQCTIEPPKGGATTPHDDALSHHAETAPFDAPQRRADEPRQRPDTPEPTPDAPDSAVCESRDHFTLVDESQRRTAQGLDRDSHEGPFEWVKLAAAAAVLALVGGAIWLLSRPPSADRLFARIEGAASTDDVAEILQVENAMSQFVDRFPDDPRCPAVRRHQRNLAVYRLRRRLERQARGSLDNRALSPAERVCIDALRFEWSDPIVAAAKYRATIDLYGDADDDRSRLCVELARRRLEQLVPRAEQLAAEQLAALGQQMRRADQFRQTDADRAAAIWRSIIELYADKPWADEVVQQARRQLAASSDKR